MKKMIFLLFAVSLVVLIPSCEKEVVESNIIYTDFPPEELFEERTYAHSYRVWVSEEDMGLSRTEGDKCIQSWSSEFGNYTYSECGIWKQIPLRSYWGIKDGVIYLSNSRNWYSISPSNFTRLIDLVSIKGTVVGYVCRECKTPWGDDLVITSFE